MPASALIQLCVPFCFYRMTGVGWVLPPIRAGQFHLPFYKYAGLHRRYEYAPCCSPAFSSPAYAGESLRKWLPPADIKYHPGISAYYSGKCNILLPQFYEVQNQFLFLPHTHWHILTVLPADIDSDHPATTTQHPALP